MRGRISKRMIVWILLLTLLVAGTMAADTIRVREGLESIFRMRGMPYQVRDAAVLQIGFLATEVINIIPVELIYGCGTEDAMPNCMNLEALAGG